MYTYYPKNIATELTKGSLGLYDAIWTILLVDS